MGIAKLKSKARGILRDRDLSGPDATNARNARTRGYALEDAAAMRKMTSRRKKTSTRKKR